MTNMKSADARRSYRMGARAEAAESTRRRVMEAAVACCRERYYDEVSLQEIADRAGVTVQTVIRRFGSKDGLLAATSEYLAPSIQDPRDAVEPGDLGAVVRTLMEHYEDMGDSVVRLQALEERIPAVADALRGAREWHRRWLARTFAASLPEPGSPEYARKLALFAVAVDVNTWKVLRREQGLPAQDTARAMLDMLERLA